MEQKNVMQKTIVVWALALVCSALWGSAFPCIKTGYQLFQVSSADSASQILFAGIRFFLAGILAIIFASFQAKKFVPMKKQAFPKVLILCIFQTVLQYICFYIGMAHVVGVKGSIISGMSTFFAILIATFIFRQEKFSVWKIIGCILGFAGLVLVNLNGMSMNMSMSFIGEGMMLLSGISYAFSSVFLKKFSKDENPVMLSGYQFIIGGLIMIVIALATGGRLHPISPMAFLLLIYMALISSVAYSLWGILLKYNPVSRITVFGFMTPVFGVFLSAVFLNEFDNLNFTCLISLVLVCLGIYMVNKIKE